MHFGQDLTKVLKTLLTIRKLSAFSRLYLDGTGIHWYNFVSATLFLEENYILVIKLLGFYSV
jgi:hypothetical protein